MREGNALSPNAAKGGDKPAKMQSREFIKRSPTVKCQ